MALSLALDPFLAALSAAFGDRPRRNEPLARYTTLRIGGLADVWLAIETVAELVEAVALARQHQIPVFLLGRGANLLISDTGIRGLVIKNQAGRVDFPPPNETKNGERAYLTTESGLNLVTLVRRCTRSGLSGLEWAAGIPGTIGGAVVNNAGAYGSDIAHCLVRAELLSPAGERVWQPVDWFDYAYRRSRLKKQSFLSWPGGRQVDVAEKEEAGWIILRAELQMTRAPVSEIQARLAKFKERRKTGQPTGATCGSMFKNPPGDYAGRLLEAAGLKGYRLGQVQISPVHANFFLNLGGATATEMMALLKKAQETVKNKFGLELELEIEIGGQY